MVLRRVNLDKEENMKKRSWFLKDPSGLCHFKSVAPGTNIHEAAKLALKNRPRSAAWFWFNGTPAPIYRDDSPESLSLRWRKYRIAYQTSRQAFLELLTNMAAGVQERLACVRMGGPCEPNKKPNGFCDGCGG